MKIVCSDETILLILQGRPHFRKFQLSPDLKLLQWESPNKDKAETEGNVVLSAVFWIDGGCIVILKGFYLYW